MVDYISYQKIRMLADVNTYLCLLICFLLFLSDLSVTNKALLIFLISSSARLNYTVSKHTRLIMEDMENVESEVRIGNLWQKMATPPQTEEIVRGYNWDELIETKLPVIMSWECLELAEIWIKGVSLLVSSKLYSRAFSAVVSPVEVPQTLSIDDLLSGVSGSYGSIIDCLDVNLHRLNEGYTDNLLVVLHKPPKLPDTYLAAAKNITYIVISDSFPDNDWVNIRKGVQAIDFVKKMPSTEYQAKCLSTLNQNPYALMVDYSLAVLPF